MSSEQRPVRIKDEERPFRGAAVNFGLPLGVIGLGLGYEISAEDIRSVAVFLRQRARSDGLNADMQNALA
jgi:hypothetical protein